MEEKQIVKVKDLIEKLKEFDENMDVVIEYPIEWWPKRAVELSDIESVERARIWDELPPIHVVVLRAC